MIDEFYTFNGWDVERGWPTAKRLRDLGMAELYEPMAEGAAKARKKRPAL